MAYIKLRNGFTSIEGNPSVLYDQNASESVEAWFERSGAAGFTADESLPVAGEYQGSSAVWELFGPDGPAVHLLPDPLNVNVAGTPAHPMTFLPTIPGRWLVRLTVLPYVSDDGVIITLSPTPEVFTGLFEIQDPNVIGHPEAREYGNGSVTRGASFIAPNESNEYDSDEGWARGLERYLATVSREQGFRSTVVVYNDTGTTLDEGKVVCAVDADAIQNWKKAEAGLQGFQNTVLRVQLAQSNNPNLLATPKFLLTETVENGERGVAIVDGIVPFDTDEPSLRTVPENFANGDAIYINSNGELTNVLPSSIDPADIDARVGVVVKGTTVDSDTNPGSIYFHGHATLLPGYISGPASSTDNAIATWDGTDGDKLQNTSVCLLDMTHLNPYWMLATIDGGLHVSSAANGNNELWLRSGGSTTGPSGEVRLTSGFSSGSRTGDIYIFTGDAYADAAGQIRVYPGRSNLEGSNVTIVGGASETRQGGYVRLTGGVAETAGLTPGGVNIRGGENTADSTYGYVTINNASEVSVTASTAANITAPLARTYAETTQWVATDPGGISGDNSKAQIFHEYAVNTEFSLMDESGLVSVSLGSDSHSYLLKKLSIGTDAAPIGSDVFRIDGNATVTGDFTIDGKLNVTGLIDPIGLILTETTAGDVPVGVGEGAIYVSSGDGNLYYKDRSGVTTNLITVGTGDISGPLAPGTTTPGQVTVWQDTGGSVLEGSVVSINASGEITTLRDPTTNVASGLSIVPGSHDPIVGNVDGADVTVQSGVANAAGNGGILNLKGADAASGNPGEVKVTGGVSTLSAVPGGLVSVAGGVGSKTTGLESAGGAASLLGGHGGSTGGKASIQGGSSIIDSPNVRIGTGDGGDVEVVGGTSGENATGGSATIQGGAGADGDIPTGVTGGGGGNVVVAAGSAGVNSGLAGGEVNISAGNGNSTSAAAGKGGNVMIAAGDSPALNVFPNAEKGGNVTIEAGDSGQGSTGDGGHVFIEPGFGDTSMGAAAKHGILHLCKEQFLGTQKSYVVIGDVGMSGLAGPVGVCAGAKSHTIHGHLKVTGIIDPIAFLLEPQASNPVKLMLDAAQASGELDASGNPIDADDIASQQMIRNAIWFDSTNADRMMCGEEPVGTRGTIQYDAPSGTVEYIEADALPYDASPDGISTGHLVPDFGSKVYYYDVPEKVGIVGVDSTAGDVAIMLPDAASFAGRSIFVKDKKGLSNVQGYGQIYIAPPSGQNLDQYAYATPYPLQPWACKQCWSDGTGWFLI